MPDRRENALLRSRLEAIQVGYEKWTRHTVRLLAILFVIQLGLGALSLYLVTQNVKRGDETRNLVTQIQQSRAASVRLTCQEQNARHDRTIATLDQVIGKLPPGTERDRAARNRQSTILLIDALAPKRDCEAWVRRLVGRPLR